MIYPPHDTGERTLLAGFYVKFANLINGHSILTGGGFMEVRKAKKKKVTSSVSPTQNPTTESSTAAAAAVGEVLNSDAPIGSPTSQVLGSETTATTVTTHLLPEYNTGAPLLVVCSSISYNPVIDMGFFEYKDMLFAKVFDLTLKLEVIGDVNLEK